jgi:AcrR family transcriptional regulator
MSEAAKKAARKHHKRSAGRPTEAGTVGQAAIVDAAIGLMRTKSPAEMSVLEVAATAGVDRALVRYYFGDKAGLVRAAAAHIMDGIQERSRAMLDERGTLQERVRRRLGLLVEALEENPRFLQLVLNELYIDDGSQARADTLLAIATRGLSLSEALLATREGEPLIRDIDPRFFHVAILGICTFFMDAQPMLAVLFKDSPDRAALKERYLDFATDLLVRGITR